MSAIKINNFEIEVWEPYPSWTTISYNGDEILKISHNEIKDLEYALKRARQLVKDKLPPRYKHEA